MTEVIQDHVEPSTFIVPVQDNKMTSGSLFKSGSALSYISGSKVWELTATEQ